VDRRGRGRRRGRLHHRGSDNVCAGNRGWWDCGLPRARHGAEHCGGSGRRINRDGRPRGRRKGAAALRAGVWVGRGG
jgi:hypothetical protein